MEQRLHAVGGPVTALIPSRPPISQVCTSRAQDSHDLKGAGAVKREDEIVLKHEAACNIRIPQVEAHRESDLEIPEVNGQLLLGNAKTANRRKLFVKPTLEGSGHTTARTAERKALPLYSTFSPVSSDGPIAIDSSERKAQNSDQENSNISAHTEVGAKKRKADAMQKTCQLHRENTAGTRSGRHIRGLGDRPDTQGLSNHLTCSLCQEAVPVVPCTTCGLRLYSKRWCDRMYQSAIRDDHDAVRYYQCHTHSHNGHDCEEVEINKIGEQHTKSTNKRQKTEHTQARDSAKPSDYANIPHIEFVENARLPADIERRGYPRLIHIENFTRETDTDNLTMADFVATILYHHNPQILTASFDEKRYLKFGFATRDPNKAQDFAIERERGEHGLVVKVHAQSLTIIRG